MKFKGPTPVAIKAVIALVLANTVAQIWLYSTIREHGRTVPDADYSHLVRLKGGIIYYVQSGLGSYLDLALPLEFVLSAVLLLLILLYRNRLERYS